MQAKEPESTVNVDPNVQPGQDSAHPVRPALSSSHKSCWSDRHIFQYRCVMATIFIIGTGQMQKFRDHSIQQLQYTRNLCMLVTTIYFIISVFEKDPSSRQPKAFSFIIMTKYTCVILVWTIKKIYEEHHPDGEEYVLHLLYYAFLSIEFYVIRSDNVGSQSDIKIMSYNFIVTIAYGLFINEFTEKRRIGRNISIDFRIRMDWIVFLLQLVIEFAVAAALFYSKKYCNEKHISETAGNSHYQKIDGPIVSSYQLV